MGRKTKTNDTQPEEAPPAPPAPPCNFEKGQNVYIKRHVVNMSGVKITYGGMSGPFVRTSYGPKDQEYITIHHEGYRTFPLEHARLKKGGSAAAAGTSKGGKVVIECVGLEGKECANTREIHAADRHLVQRCKECQKEYAKITNRERMRARRAEKKAQREDEKKKMGRDS